MVGCSLLLFCAALYLGAAGKTLASPILVAFFMEVGQQMQMTANATRILSVNPAARARFNAVFVIFIFAGQVLGTQASSTLFLRYGYRATGGFWLGIIGLSMATNLSRGPHVDSRRFFGYQGGWRLVKPKPSLAPPDAEVAPSKLEQNAVEMK
jgi:hypothetical protein